MFGPLLQEPSEVDEIDKAIMHVSHSKGALIIAVKMMDLPYHILLDLLLVLRPVLIGVIVENVRRGLILMFKDAELFDATVVLFERACDFTVEGGVVASHIGLG
jgi:hypothetical protein